MKHSPETRTEYLKWFCSSLRHNTNVLSHYTHDVTGCGEHLKNELRKTFFLVFNGIVKQLEECTDESEIKFLLNCCKWQFTATDHDSLVKSGIFEVLTNGNGKKEKSDNPIKFCWGHKFKFDAKEEYPLCQEVLDLFEQILIACFARLVQKDSGEQQKLKTSGTAIPGMEKAHSLVNTTTTEALLANGFKTVFQQLERYSKLIKKFEGIEWEFYVSKRNSQRKKGEAIDEINENELDDETEDSSKKEGEGEGDESKKEDETSVVDSSVVDEPKDDDKKEDEPKEEEKVLEKEEDSKSQKDDGEKAKSEKAVNADEGEGEGDNENDDEEEPKDKVREKVEEKENKEIEKLKKLYEEKYITRFLKLIEIFTSIAASQSGVLGMVLKVATPQELTILVDLLVYAPPRHGLTIVKILDNLIRIGIPHELFDESVTRLANVKDSLHDKILNLLGKFKTAPFLRFLYNYTISIRSCMWNDDAFESNGAFILSKAILSKILSSNQYPKYKRELTEEIDNLLDNLDKYDIEEIETLLSTLSGAEYLGLGLGANGISSDGSMFTVLGFVDKWYGIKNPSDNPNQNQNENEDEFKVHTLYNHLGELSKDDLYILALYYDPKHPERNDIFTAVPEEVKLIGKLEKEKTDILLDETRINKFLKNLKLDEKFNKTDYKACTIRTMGLKILEQYVVDHGEEFIKLIDEKFYNSFLKLLYSEACSPSSSKSTMQNEWIEQKIYALQEYATENNASLRPSTATKAKFSDKELILTKVLRSAGNQRYSKCIDLVSAMNYGRVIQGENYAIQENFRMPDSEEDRKKVKQVDLRLVDPDDVDTVDRLHEQLKSAKILLSCDVDIEGLHKQLVEKDAEIGYFRSVVLVSKTDFKELKKFLKEDPDFKQINTEGLTPHEIFIKEMVEYGGFDEKILKEILKGHESDALSKKTNLISDWCKKQEELKDKEKKEDKKDKTEEEKDSTPATSSLGAGEEIIDTTKGGSQAVLTKADKPDEGSKEEEDKKEEFDVESIFGLENDEKFKKIFENVKQYGSTSYDDNANKPKKKKGELYKSAYSINKDNVEGEYATAVSNFYTSMCRKTIMSFFKIAKVNNLMKLLLSNKKDTENFIKFIKIIGNELSMTKLNMIDDKPYDDLKTIISSIIKACYSHSDFTPFLHKLLNDVIIDDTIKGLKKALEGGAKEVKTYFNNETIALETMNMYILVDIINLYIKECPELIFENEKHFKKMMSMLFLIPCVFRGDAKLQKYVYTAILKIVVMVQQDFCDHSTKPIEGLNNISNSAKKIKEDLLSLKIFKKLIESIEYQKDSSNSYNFKLTDEHKLLFEIFLKFSQIHQACISEGIEPIYTYTEPLLQVEACKAVLKERKKFDHIAYVMYLDELDEASKKSTIMVETQHNHYHPKVSACLRNEGFKKMVVKIQNNTELEKFSSVVITSDKKGDNVLKNIFQKEITDSKAEVTVFSNSCYVHYPYRQPKIIGFGEKDNSKLGTEASSESTKEPEIIPEIFVNLKTLVSHQSFAVALDESGKFYETGQKDHFSSQYNKFTEIKVKGFKETEDEFVKLVAGFNNIILLTKKGKIYIEGSNEQYQIDDQGDKYEFFEKKTPNEEEDPVVDVAAGRFFHLIVTKSGKLYGAGNYFLKDIKLECGKKYAKIELPSGVKAKKVYCSNVEKPTVAYVMVETGKGKRELWSAGESSKGLLGQGEEKKKSATFAKVDYDSDKIQFTEVFAKYDHTLALTKDGQLYGWGCNIQHRMGLKKEGDKFTPTHITPFKDYIVRKVSVGVSHSLVIASPKKTPEVKMVFSLGKEEGIFSHYGITEEESKTTEVFVTHLKMFDHLDPYLIEAGNKTSFVAVKGDAKPSSNVGVHEGLKCEVTKQSPIVGTLHFYKDDKKLHCYSEEGYNQVKDKLPSIVFATKYPIKDLNDKKLPSIKDRDSLSDSDELGTGKYPAYVANCKAGEKPMTKLELTEREFLNANVHDLDPLIFYRITRPLKEGRTLPEINLNDFFNQTEQKGLYIELSPDYSYMKNDVMIEKSKDVYNEIYEQAVKFPKSCDRELLECLEKHITEKDMNFEEDKKVEISPSDLTFKNKRLKGLPDKTKQQRINAMIKFNQYFLKVIPYVLLDEETLTEMATSTDKMSDKLNELFILGKGMAFSSIKNKYIKNIVNNLPSNYDQPDVSIKRRRAQVFRDRGKVDHKGEYTVFGQIWKVLKNKNYQPMKKNDTSSQAWRASLIGEGAIDAGGPYRESITNMCSELMHKVLPLFIPTQNNKNDHGLGRDCWTINPSAISPTHLEMYEFVGALMGMAFRSGQILDLKLTSFFYKGLAGEPLTMDDLTAIDLYSVQAIKELQKTKEKISEEMFDSYASETMTTRLSNGEECDLVPHGKDVTVKHKDIDNFIKMTLDARFKEGEKQMQAIRKGFEIIFPTTVMGILTYKEVEYRIIGPTEIDVEQLKKITQYSCCSSTDEYVERFWRVFEGFTQEERSMYLKFVWGRSRLPPPDSDRIQRHVLYLMSASSYSDHNNVLPQAHTCFFQLDLPRYTKDSSCRDKILYAIESCGEIDTDGSSRYISNEEDDIYGEI